MNQAASREISQRQAYYALFVLWLVNVLANIDRFSVGIVLQKIKTDLQLTDTQLGLFSGAAFVVSYVAFGIPVARWLDRGIRRNILSLAVGVWSLMTLATGMAANFVQLAMARAGLGAGEAACAPGAMSLIGDYFSRDWRTQATRMVFINCQVESFGSSYSAGLRTLPSRRESSCRNSRCATARRDTVVCGDGRR